VARTRERGLLESQRYRQRTSSVWMDDAIKSGYFNIMCDCGHTRGGHRGLRGLDECFECACLEFNTVATRVEVCLCGHLFVEHAALRGTCWVVGCECQSYRPSELQGIAPLIPVRRSMRMCQVSLWTHTSCTTTRT
jgi:hypothetical protein